MYDLGSVRVDEKEPGRHGVSLSEAPRANSGGRVLKMGAASPLSEGEVWERCKFPQRGPGWSPTAQRFSCTSRSPGILFCYVIEGKQLQNSLNLTARGVAPTPWGARNYMNRGSYQLHQHEFCPLTPLVNLDPGRSRLHTAWHSSSSLFVIHQ